MNQNTSSNVVTVGYNNTTDSFLKNDLFEADVDIISQEVSENLEFAFECILFPIITVFGVTGNVLSVIVLFQKRLFSPTTILLIGLTFADGLFLVSHFLRKIPCWIEKVDPELSNHYYVLVTMPLFYLKTSFSRVSGLLIAAISIERFLAVVYPLKVRHLVTKSKMLITVVLIYVTTLGMLSPMCLQTTTFSINGRHFVKSSELYLNNGDLFDIYNTSVTPVIFRWIPKLFVISFNFAIIWKLIVHMKLSRQLSTYAARPTQARNQRRITKMLLIIAISFVVCLIPGDAFIIASDVVDGFSYYGKYRKSFAAFSNVAVTFDMINSSVNFAIYLSYSSTFSSVYVKLFFPCKMTGTSGNNAAVVTSSRNELYSVSSIRTSPANVINDDTDSDFDTMSYSSVDHRKTIDHSLSTHV